MKLSDKDKDRLLKFGKKLVFSNSITKIIEPHKSSEGFWFGGGNFLFNKEKNKMFLIGRYRDVGDSRFGVGKGRRGWKVSIFESEKKEFTKKGAFKEIISLEKKKGILSYEGCALFEENGKMHCLISSEKEINYPDICKEYQKKGTGVWSIDSHTINLEKRELGERKSLLEFKDDISYLHIKDPSVSKFKGKNLVLYCCSPFNWSCSVSGYAFINKNSVNKRKDGFFKKGMTWDGAMGRITCRIPIPKVGIFKELPDISLYFYDSCECVNKHKDNINVKGNPRGYSCEEISSLAYGFDEEFPKLHRMSILEPLFFSKDKQNKLIGTGSLRYINVICDNEGNYFTLFQKSERDKSQPLFATHVTKQETKEIFY